MYPLNGPRRPRVRARAADRQSSSTASPLSVALLTVTPGVMSTMEFVESITV